MSEAQKRPAKTFGPVWTGSGTVDVAVWANSTDNRVKYSVTMHRSYNVNGAWKETQTLYDHDLLALARLLERAWEWIVSQPRGEPGGEGSSRK